ncbi:MAG: tRNA (adenosine(37)-N6)-threonylcarbamoyltransferase complex ATPase subunit type 1 TsaE [Anaerobutyricum sp.]|nr:tRNA (adenosine(37)-N6)-threonylcarbamoyltransferase complex ATPase subunit type 1 TsaE [Eubacterium sp.]MDY6046861.1 tRNA (adenosine(37)-N6)-threonylcarbamoyltransferase complex ATPase subunit type 1 TsaE [Anaerobutyricum sp.]
MKIESFSAEDTFAYGRKCGQEAKAGQVFCLYGDLGVGKTVFTQGFAEGLGITEPVSSPTFTIVQVYEEGRLPFYHFDVYRIADPEEMYEVGFDDYIEGDGVCFIEWANLIDDLLPEERTEITIEKDLSKGFDYRLISRKEIQ